MIRQMPLKQFGSGPVDFVPQAVLSRSTDFLAETLGIEFEKDADDPDAFMGALVYVNPERPVEIKHYSGHPAGTVTLYLPDWLNRVEAISAAIDEILHQLKLHRDALLWERADDPEL